MYVAAGSKKLRFLATWLGIPGISEIDTISDKTRETVWLVCCRKSNRTAGEDSGGRIIFSSDDAAEHTSVWCFSRGYNVTQIPFLSRTFPHTVSKVH